MLLFQLLKRLSSECEIPHYSVNSRNFPERLDEFAIEPSPFTGKTGCFGPLRFPVPLPEATSFEVVLHLRDPRDAVTSLYYSHAYSHPLNTAQRPDVRGPTMDERNRAQREGIDAFVLRSSRRYESVYQTYLGEFSERWRPTILRYEDMVADVGSWLEKLVAHFPVEDPAGFVRGMAEQLAPTFHPQQEDVTRHVRQVRPGDHRRKLKPATIEALNHRFAPFLEALGYSS